MSEAKGDPRVTEVQEWLNETYGAQSWFTKLTVDGMTGAGTCKALCKALQYEIGVKNVDGVIGAGTLAVCPTIGATVTNTNLIKIIQCGFYCKGYECGGITGHYGAAVEIAAQRFKMDAGFDAGNGELQPIFIRALLNTDAFVLVKNGKDYVREAQQYLNNTYIVKLSNWALIPCNGIPDRNMMKAIIAGLQYEEANHSTSGVDGIYGKNTLSKAPTLSSGTAKTAYVKIVQMCLMCMMETNAGMDGAFGSALKKQIEEFQKFIAKEGLVTGGTGAKVRPVVSCKGTTCQYGLLDSYAVSEEIYRRFYEGYREVALPHKFKIAVGGCPNNCVKPDLNDVGIIGQRIPNVNADVCKGCKKCAIEAACPNKVAKVVDGKIQIDKNICKNCGRCVGKCPFHTIEDGAYGYKIYIGGRWGKKVSQGKALGRIFTSKEEALDVIEKAILFFRDNGIKGERFAETIERIGFENVEKQLLEQL